MIAQSRKHKDHWTIAGLTDRGEDALWIRLLKGGCRLGRALADHDSAVKVATPPDLQGIGHIGEALAGVLTDMANEVRRRALERGIRFGREHQRVPGPRLARRLNRRRLFEHDVGVGAAEAESAHS